MIRKFIVHVAIKDFGNYNADFFSFYCDVNFVVVVYVFEYYIENKDS